MILKFVTVPAQTTSYSCHECSFSLAVYILYYIPSNTAQSPVESNGSQVVEKFSGLNSIGIPQFDLFLLEPGANAIPFGRTVGLSTATLLADIQQT